MQDKAKKRYKDEEIIAALISAGTIRGAALELNCMVRTIYERMKKPEFQELYRRAKGEILKAAAAKLQGQLGGAIDTLVTVMNDPDAAKQTRVNAAMSILQYAARLTETTDIIERLEAIEAAQAAEI